MFHQVTTRLDELADGRFVIDDTNRAELDTLVSFLGSVLANAIPDQPVEDGCSTATMAGLERTVTAVESDPLNAFVRRCVVEPTGPGPLPGPLSGRRIAIKDSIAVAGIPMTCGSRVLSGFVPSLDSVVVQRLLAAGGSIVAITNMDSLAFSGGGESSDFGPTLNPHDHDHAAGGSSGGSAAALHYPDIDIAIGTDQGGSIRVPAAWCGVIGLKPTHGAIPYDGIVGIHSSLDHVGPMGRNSRDVALTFDVLTGMTGTASTQAAVDRAQPQLAGLRIGLVSEASDERVGVDAETAKAMSMLIGQLRELGADVVTVSLPEHLDAGATAFAVFIDGLMSLVESVGDDAAWNDPFSTEFAQAFQAGIASRGEQLSSQVKCCLMMGRYLRRYHPGSLLAGTSDARAALAAAYQTALNRVDVLLMPTTPGRAHRFDSTLPVAERVTRGWAVLANTTPTNLTGHPALSIPISGVSGLPVGAMLIGQRGGEATLLSIARSYEISSGHPTQ